MKKLSLLLITLTILFVFERNPTNSFAKTSTLKGYEFNTVTKNLGLNNKPKHPRKKSYSKSKGKKTVHVKGYYRKNGTYVHSYTRRAPRKRK